MSETAVRSKSCTRWPYGYGSSSHSVESTMNRSVMFTSCSSSGAPQGERRRVNLRSIVEGVEFIWIERIILSLFLLDFGVTLVGFYRPILPIFAADVFKMGAAGLGVLYGAPSLGAVLGSVTLLMLGDVRRKGVLVVVAAVIFAASLALLGLSQWFWMALGAVLILGFTDALSVAIRRTVVQILAPDRLLGRASSLITVFSQATNGLGAILAGAAAQAWGAPNALLVGSGICFLDGLFDGLQAQRRVQDRVMLYEEVDLPPEPLSIQVDLGKSLQVLFEAPPVTRLDLG